MFCPECGMRIDSGSKFCKYCFTSLVKKPDAPIFDTPSNVRKARLALSKLEAINSDTNTEKSAVSADEEYKSGSTYLERTDNPYGAVRKAQSTISKLKEINSDEKKQDEPCPAADENVTSDTITAESVIPAAECDKSEASDKEAVHEEEPAESEPLRKPVCYCSGCGKPDYDGAPFCPDCGRILTLNDFYVKPEPTEENEPAESEADTSRDEPEDLFTTPEADTSHDEEDLFVTPEAETPSEIPVAKVPAAPKTESDFIICAVCGEKNIGRALFCGGCGTDLSKKKTDIAENKDFKLCPKCGGRNIAKAIFCGDCGTVLS